jgi:hypothetical protein
MYRFLDHHCYRNSRFCFRRGTSGFVKLTGTGTKINLRPNPHAGGSVVAQANNLDSFAADALPITDFADAEEWYSVINGDEYTPGNLSFQISARRIRPSLEAPEAKPAVQVP